MNEVSGSWHTTTIPEYLTLLRKGSISLDTLIGHNYEDNEEEEEVQIIEPKQHTNQKSANKRKQSATQNQTEQTNSP
jgi:hypothetical protein